MEKFLKFLHNLRNKKGQTVIEYVLVIVLISLVLIIVFRSGPISKALEIAETKIANEIAPGAPGPTKY